MGDAQPYSKDAQLARGERRYKRKVASPKQWQAIIAAKRDSCRVCEVEFGGPGLSVAGIELHHLVARVHGGGDEPDNIVPLCAIHHADITKRNAPAARALLSTLSDAEYAYMIDNGGEDYPVRAYGVSYGR